ncbi:MAG: M20 family metallo-hydrolase [Deltaproteobacteria bacterium]|nr:M20 family metallo-hydrolase [Deltaproteobacteria bacterium]
MKTEEKVFKKIDTYRDEIILFQSELTKRVALGPDNGGTGEHEKACYLKERFQDMNPDILFEIKAPDNRAHNGYRPNIIAGWGKNDSRPVVWILSHTDIVPPGDLSLWTGDPYKVRVDGDKITGRGVEDNQHGIVASTLAAKAVIESGLKHNNIGLIMAADEETGSRYGLDYILKNNKELFKPDDLILVPDWGVPDGSMIEIAEKSMLWLKFTLKGRQCHASTPEQGKNTLFGVARLILELEKLKEVYNFRDELFSPPYSTFEPTKIEANVPNVNTIPGKDIFYMDCRVLPAYKLDEILKYIRNAADRVKEELSLEITIEQVNREDASAATPVNAPVVTALKRAIKKVKGVEASTKGIGGGTVAAFFRRAGLNAAVWSTCLDVAHQPDEYCRIPDIIDDIKVFASIFLDESIE